MSESPAKRIADFIANAEDAIANGYRTEWEPGVCIWQLRQCSDRAQSLNSSLYGPVVTTITDQRLKTQVTEGCDGDLVRLLLNLRKRFGSNAGVIQIHNAAEFGNLKPFTSSANLGHDLKTFLTYHDQTDPNVFKLSTSLSRLYQFIEKERDADARTELLRIYSGKLVRFGEDPIGTAKKLLDELELELVQFASGRQTSQAIKGKKTSSVHATSNLANQPCIPYHKFSKCEHPDGECPRSHDKALLKEKMKLDWFKEFYESFTRSGPGRVIWKKNKGDKGGGGRGRGGGKGDKGNGRGQGSSSNASSNNTTKTGGRLSLSAFMLRRNPNEPVCTKCGQCPAFLVEAPSDVLCATCIIKARVHDENTGVPASDCTRVYCGQEDACHDGSDCNARSTCTKSSRRRPTRMSPR